MKNNFLSSGRAYPYGDIAKDQVETVKKDVYNCLTRLHAPKKATNKGQNQDSAGGADHELLYPYLRTLLSFDTQGFLNVLSIGKKHALKKYDQFALNTSCFWGSTGSNITPVQLCIFTTFLLQK